MQKNLQVHQVQKNLQILLTHPQKSKSFSISSIKLERWFIINSKVIWLVFVHEY
jgi:hypothetical protein